MGRFGGVLAICVALVATLSGSPAAGDDESLSGASIAAHLAALGDGVVLLPSPCAVYDSRTATGDLGGPVPANSTRTVLVTGDLPAAQGTGTGSCVPVGAVSALVTIAAVDPAGAGNFRLAARGTSASGGVVNYVSNGLNNANTVAVPLGADGRVDIFANNAAADARVAVLGYVGSGGTLQFNSVVPCAALDTRPDQGPAAAYLGPFSADTVDLPVVDVVGAIPSDQGTDGGDCGVPVEAEAVVVNLVAVRADGGSGYLSVGPSAATPIEPVTYYADLGLNNATAAVVPLDESGAVAISGAAIQGQPTIHVRVVILGFLAETGAGLVPVDHCAAFDTRNIGGAVGDFSGRRLAGEGGVTTYQISGIALEQQGGLPGGCGVPADASAVLINLVAIDPLQVGNLRAYPSGSTPTGGVLNFGPTTPAMNNSNAVMVPLSAEGRIELYVNAPVDGIETVHARGVVVGYFGGSSPVIDDTQLLQVAADGPYAPGIVVGLSASAFDAQDGDLSESINWTTSDGTVLGQGSSVEASLGTDDLSVVATVTDSDGVLATADAVVTVEPSDGLAVVVPTSDRWEEFSDGQIRIVDELLVVTTDDGEAGLAAAEALATASAGEVIGGSLPLGLFQIRYPGVGEQALGEIAAFARTFGGIEAADFHGRTTSAATEPEEWYPDGATQRDEDLAWPYEAINATEAWDLETSAAEVNVLITDKSIFAAHEDLTFSSPIERGLAPAVAFESLALFANVGFAHGSHVTGLACADAQGIGVTGAAWGCRLHAVDDLEAPEGFMIEAIRRTLANGQATGQPIWVVNMSWGDGPVNPDNCDVPAKRTVGLALAKLFNDFPEVLFVPAAGNCGNRVDPLVFGDTLVPASFGGLRDHVLTVAAIDRDFALWEHPTNGRMSNWGPAVEIAAPGANIISTVHRDCVATSTTLGCVSDYEPSSGTSMAAPLVAGTAALLFAENPALTAAQAKYCLVATGRQGAISGDPERIEGLVLLDAAAALRCASATAGGVPATVYLDETFGPSGNVPSLTSGAEHMLAYRGDINVSFLETLGVFQRNPDDTRTFHVVDDQSTWVLDPITAFSMSDDGRYVVIDSQPFSTSQAVKQLDVHVVDRATSAVELISTNPAGLQGDDESFGGVISANGNFVAFVSLATDLVVSDTNGVADVFLRNLQTGVTSRVSVASDGTELTEPSRVGAISGDGRYVTFATEDRSLMPGVGAGLVEGSFIHDTVIGTTSWISSRPEGGFIPGRTKPVDVTPDGRFVLIVSELGLAYLRDTQNDELTLLDLPISSMWSAINSSISMSDDGRYFAFESDATGLSPVDLAAASDVFVHDRETDRTTLVSIGSDGSAAVGWSSNPSIDPTGRFVAFSSSATNIVEGVNPFVGKHFLADGLNVWFNEAGQ